MSWKCWRQNQFDGKRHIALVAFDGDTPRLVGCLECDWRDVVDDDLLRDEEEQGLRRIYEQGRCIAATTAGGRCTRTAPRGGDTCSRHEDRVEKWDRVYRSFRSPWAEVRMPEAYREIFIRAIWDAELVAKPQPVPRETFEQASRLRRASVVYFVKRGDYIKIGVTTNLQRRLASLANGGCVMPEGMTLGPVEVLATTPGDRRTESVYHERFRKLRAAGEWFRPNKALWNCIGDLQRAERNGREDILDEVLKSA